MSRFCRMSFTPFFNQHFQFPTEIENENKNANFIIILEIQRAKLHQRKVLLSNDHT